MRPSPVGIMKPEATQRCGARPSGTWARGAGGCESDTTRPESQHILEFRRPSGAMETTVLLQEEERELVEEQEDDDLRQWGELSLLGKTALVTAAKKEVTY